MTYESLVSVCQLVAMTLFGGVMVGIAIYALRPANKSRFEAAARLALRDDNETREPSHGR